jgi:hypothetical protein
MLFTKFGRILSEIESQRYTICCFSSATVNKIAFQQRKIDEPTCPIDFLWGLSVD